MNGAPIGSVPSAPTLDRGTPGVASIAPAVGATPVPSTPQHGDDAAIGTSPSSADASAAAPARRRGRPRKSVAPPPMVVSGADAAGTPCPSADTAAVPARSALRRARPGLSLRGVSATASDRARLVAAMVLEVLAGARTPAEAAAVMEVVPVRYYQVEARALSGLIRGCEPAVVGRPASGSSADDRLRGDHQRLLAERRRLTEENARLQALLRTARTAFGMPAPAKVPAPAGAGRGATTAHAGKRRRRVRALRLAGVVRPAATTTGTTGTTAAAPPTTPAPPPS